MKKTTRKKTQRLERDEYLGRTEDGVRIIRPDFEPESFTLEQLEKAVRAAKRRQAAEQLG